MPVESRKKIYYGTRSPETDKRKRTPISNCKSARVHIWIPDYEASLGGIQTFTKFFVRALGECLPDADFSLFCKNDNSFPGLPARRGQTFFYGNGWCPHFFRTPVFTTQLLHHALREQPDVVLSTHVNFTPVAQALNRMIKIPYVAVAHGVDVWGDTRRMDLGRALRKAASVWAVSRFTRERMLAELGLRNEQVTILPNTVDADSFTPSIKPRYLLKRYGLKPDQPVILTIARLASGERYKGYDQVLRALLAIRRVIPEAHYLIGGRGPDRPRIESLIRELNLAGAVTLAGFVPDYELCDFYNVCDVFAMPSKREGFGIVFLEALACGKPVLAGNKDGSVDALLDGELGVLADPDNVAKIADALTAILLHKHPLAILRQPQMLRNRVIAAYGYEQFVRRLRRHLESLGLLSTASENL